jgi:hypothetical protein
MARRVLVVLPNGAQVTEDDINVTRSQRLAGFLIVIGFIGLMCLAGGAQ